MKRRLILIWSLCDFYQSIQTLRTHRAMPEVWSIQDEEGQTIIFGLLQEKVENQGDSWVMSTDSVGRFFERVILKAKKEKLPKACKRAFHTF